MAADDVSWAGERGIVTARSRYSFAETVRRLNSAFETHGIKIFVEIDQQAEAASVGIEMPPTMLIVFGNPRSGTALMLARPLSALDLPLKVLVSEATAGEVMVSFNRARYLIERYALPDELSANIAPAECLIANAVSA